MYVPTENAFTNEMKVSWLLMGNDLYHFFVDNFNHIPASWAFVLQYEITDPVVRILSKEMEELSR